VGTAVTLNTDPTKVDIVEDYTNQACNTVHSYTMLKTDYINKLTKEQEQLTSSIASLNQLVTDNTANVTTYTTRSSEITGIINDVNSL